MEISNNVTSQELLATLSDFHAKYLSSTKFITELYDSYINAFDLAADIVGQIGKHTVLSELGVYRKIPFFLLRANTGLYNIDNLRLTNADFSDWNSLSLANRVATLDKYGYYESLAYSLAKTRNSAIVGSALVKSLEIDRFVKDEYSYKYEEFTDYVVKNNKLYFFGDLAKYSGNITGEGKLIILKNIMIDCNDVYLKWGVFTGIPKPPYLTDQEYLKAIPIILYAMQDGPKITNLTQAVRSVTGWNTITIEDMYSGSELATFKPFDFVVSIPTEATAYPDKLAYMRYLLDRIKPSYACYSFNYAYVYTDQMNEMDDSVVSFDVTVTNKEALSLRESRVEGTFLNYSYFDNAYLMSAMTTTSESRCYMKLYHMDGGNEVIDREEELIG